MCTVFHEITWETCSVIHTWPLYDKFEVYKIMNGCKNSGKNISDSRGQETPLQYYLQIVSMCECEYV